jgi:hypothetical protein
MSKRWDDSSYPNLTLEQFTTKFDDLGLMVGEHLGTANRAQFRVAWQIVATFLQSYVSASFEGDHNDISARDAADAHPIGAITGLQDELNGKLSTTGPETFDNVLDFRTHKPTFNEGADTFATLADVVAEVANQLGELDPQDLQDLITLLEGIEDINDFVLKSAFSVDHSLLTANTSNNPAALNVPEQRLVGRITGGNITALTAAQVKTLLAIAATEVSGFDTQVRTNRLDQMAAPTLPVSANSQRITNLGTPTSATDVAHKGYVDTIEEVSITESTTITDAHMGKLLVCNAASPIALTINTGLNAGSSTARPWFQARQDGDGELTIVAGTATVRRAPKKAAEKWAIIGAVCRGSDDWTIFGEHGAVE